MTTCPMCLVVAVTVQHLKIIQSVVLMTPIDVVYLKETIPSEDKSALCTASELSLQQQREFRREAWIASSSGGPVEPVSIVGRFSAPDFDMSLKSNLLMLRQCMPISGTENPPQPPVNAPVLGDQTTAAVGVVLPLGPSHEQLVQIVI